MEQDWEDYWRNHPNRVISGICKCGHSADDHHGSLVLSQEVYDAQMKLWPKMNGRCPGACEFYGFNETEGLDEEGNPHCFSYTDEELP